ncbi:class II aldolase/adducin family protein [Dactylosporangium sp. CA-092794]|uniref:class II aldolase/adducin family protein n=1 Tax=Dactylosporangium sp. CA-092794 TaxID=3239929 RepID=UPI003D8A578F
MTANIETETQTQTEIEARRELAAVFRLVAHFGMTDLIYTHISARLPGTGDRFLINPYGLLFEEITASSLVEIGADGQAVREGSMRVNPAGFVIHSAIHLARHDAKCVLHTHTKAGCAVAAQAGGLLPLNQMSMEFYNRVGYHDYEGVALDLDEQQRLVADIGTHNALILRNHGLLTVGETPGAAFLRMFYLDRACQIQVEAQHGSGELVIPSPAVAERTARQLNLEDVGDTFADTQANDLAWAAMLRLVARVAPDYAD